MSKDKIMETRVMFLPYGDILVGKEQYIEYLGNLKWHIYWIHESGNKYVSVKGRNTKAELIKIAKKWNWTIVDKPNTP
jgi:hypothetical protein